jgi:exopolysaccharide/PEP-CTERM locus tyrosine autokinase
MAGDDLQRSRGQEFRRRPSHIATFAGGNDKFNSETVAPIDDARLVSIDPEQLRDAGLLASVDQEQALADQFRIIKRPLLDHAVGRFADISNSSNLIMVASALPGDGKSFVSVNLALSMAIEKDISVVLVDADVIKPHISSVFGIEDEPGLIDLLTDKSLEVGDLLLPTIVPGLRLLPAGKHSGFTTELIASKRMENVAATLSQTFPDRVVIFDSPPLLATSESPVLASLMGQIVMVVGAGKTPRHAVLEAIGNLDSDKPINLVLNQAGHGLQSGYGQYGYGYRYGS